MIPNYNYGLYLPTCLESVLRQPGIDDLKLVVIDNCSTDNSVEILKSYADRDPRVVIHAHEKNVGLISSLSEGVRWAVNAGRHVHDVLRGRRPRPGALARAAAVFAASPTVGLVHGKAVKLPGNSWPGWSRQKFRGFEIEKGET